MSEISSRIDTLLAEKGLKRTDLAKACGLGESSIRMWSKSEPTATKLYKVAQYLGVSVEYLITGIEMYEKGQQQNPPVYTYEEKQLQDVYHKLDDEKKELVKNMIKQLSKTS